MSLIVVLPYVTITSSGDEIPMLPLAHQQTLSNLRSIFEHWLQYKPSQTKNAVIIATPHI
jgi:hypothetical protein